MKKILCIIQAHTTSTRLPNKIFKDLGGKPMIKHVIERVRKSNKIDDIVIATTDRLEDDIIEKFCINENVKFFRGSEKNVLLRYYKAAQYFKADIIVRITSDCPLIDYNIIDNAINFFNKNSYDYVSPSSDLGLIRGLDTEVFSFESLEKTLKLAKKLPELEHVTLFMYNHPKIFKIGRPEVDEVYKNSKLRLCVDEEDDYKLMKHIYEKFYNSKDIINTAKVITYLEKNEKIRKINYNVKQKIYKVNDV